MKKIKEKLAKELEKTVNVEVEAKDIERPKGEHGDFAYPVMRVASEKGEKPRELAEELLEEIQIDIVDRLEVAGPGYLNFFLNREKYSEIVKEELESKEMGVDQKEGKVRIDFSAPNLAKPMHIGHMRNNALGDSLQRIMRFAGYNVTSENYIGDWGTQFGKAITAYKHFGDQEQFEENPIDHMAELYVRFHNEVEENPELEEEATNWSRKIEEDDEEAKRLWKMFREATIEYNSHQYERMGIEFDQWTGESTVAERARELVDQWIEEGKVEEDEDGSVFFEFDDEDIPGAVLRRADGATLYFTRDIANLHKVEEKGFDYNLYIVGSEQELHFQQVFTAAEELGIDVSGSEHISYGLLSLPEGSMSSREGNVIRLSTMLDKATKEAEKRIENREIDNAEAVGIGAVKYANLSVSRNKDIEFAWDQVLSFEGDSGPYLQYSNTRAKSILKKAEKSGELAGELEDQEYRLLKKLAEFPEKIEEAAEQRDPAKIANYLSLLSEDFNSFYHDCPVIDSKEEKKKRRLKIVGLFVEVTDQGLELLGIEPLEEM